jgi:hypothetical protein
MLEKTEKLRGALPVKKLVFVAPPKEHTAAHSAPMDMELINVHVNAHELRRPIIFLDNLIEELDNT